MADFYTYKATAVRVIDGDTVVLDVDLGFDITKRMTFRLHGIDAPELRTNAGKAAKCFLIESIASAAVKWLIVRSIKDKADKYGRYLCILSLDDPKEVLTINAKMVANGHAKEYDGGKR
jgi:micrococcal nuclease